MKVEITTPGDREVVVVRAFNAPATLVFDAWTKPELIRRWLLGPEGWTMPVCEVDLRVGGRYRYVWSRASQGITMGMGGVYREIAAPQRLVATEKFDEAYYPGEALNTLVFSERGGLTTMTLTTLYASAEARDAALRSGMADGIDTSYDRLEEVLASLGPQAR
jgi:uncharacterized protein YndB with AHSA1/START domain